MAQGDNSVGLLITSEHDNEVRNQVSLSDTTLSSTLAAGVNVEGLADVSLNGSTVTGGNGVFMQVSGDVDLQANGSTLNGAIQTAEGGVTKVALDGDTVWNISGDSNLSSLQNNNSTIVFSFPQVEINGVSSFSAFNSSPFKTLTVEGDYAGNNGLFVINTALGDDNSLTDKLVVKGDTSGSSFLKVNNAGGTGAYTTADGIEVIQVGGASNGAFALAGRVVAGTKEYLLAKGGKSDPLNGNWYLRSEMPVEPEQPPVEPEQPPVEPEQPPVEPEQPPVEPEQPPVEPEQPPVEPEQPPVEPEQPPTRPEQPEPPQEVYRPEIGSYLANRYSATNMFRHTRHDRIGDFDYRGDSQSVWVRGDVDTFKAKTASSQIKLDTYSNSLQVGGHLWETDVSDYRVQLGWMVGKGKAKTQSSSLLTGYGASSSVEGYSYGAYGTLFSNSGDQTGPYLDAWLSRGVFDNEVKGQDLDKEAYRSHLLTGSLEAGYTFHIGDTSEFAYMVEPQAQVIVNKYDMKEHREVNGTQVSTAKSTGVTTRVGARVFTRPHDKMNHRVRPFMEANWWHDNNDYAASFNGDKVSLDLNKNMFEGKLGAEIELSKDVKMWTSISAEVSPGSQSNVGGQIGIKYTW